MKRRTVTLVVLSLLLAGADRASAAPIIYSQTTNMFGANASQNDTNVNGNYATVYDNFVLGVNSTVTDVHWTGSYFNPGTQGTITAFTIAFYADTLGQPGGTLLSQTVAGTAGETAIGPDFFGNPTFTYSLILPTSFLATGGTTYWLSIVASSGFPPQWGWEASGAGGGGDGKAYQDFFGTRTLLPGDFAFDLTGEPTNAAVPEPVSLTLLGSGLVGLIGRRMRQRRR